MEDRDRIPVEKIVYTMISEFHQHCLNDKLVGYALILYNCLALSICASLMLQIESLSSSKFYASCKHIRTSLTDLTLLDTQPRKYARQTER